ncbi:hypothetical protein B4096_2593 [Heyndrickxia coagulans]|uniref:Uncharacterized protein n=1 Tax=Heyndrickxia coagulans TaxID=1398 RepID=A0A150JSS0_HEYCO|nr:hypothetical protein B4098_2965 [Heyndrickxia coagulans]KYC64073.1 hypothetical protein B4100_3207 [Heyndrickxia coagulans]KYC67245.1 hypothetical protein B4099_3067 [Heyndrickxia coagulans]KYC91638.1 hypothetical protein B4096_2593 [Heyndrickxia coagulans]
MAENFLLFYLLFFVENRDAVNRPDKTSSRIIMIDKCIIL